MIGWRRVTFTVLAAIAVMAGACGGAAAQPATPAPPPADPGTSTTYGFDQVCNQIHDVLSSIPNLGGFAGDLGSAVCKAGNAASHPGSAIEATKSKLWDSTFGQVTEILLDGLGDAMSWSMLWARLPNDHVLADPGTGGETLWQRIDSYTRQLQTWLLAFSILVSALRIGIARQHMAAEHAEEAFRTLVRATATTWIAGFAILAGARLTDAFSLWIINDATNGNARGAAELLVRTDRFGVYGPGLVFVVALVGILGALAMTFLTIIRQALLVVAVGIYPLTAAASGMSGGRAAFQRLGAWIVAFLLFKPVAALVYMIAFVTADSTNTAVEQGEPGSADSAHRALVGMVLLCSVAFVLPALVRLVAPALSMVGSGGSGASAAGAAVGAGVVAVTGGKALLARGAVSGGAGSAGFVAGGPGPAPTGHRGPPPSGGGPGGGGGSPKPLPGPRGAGGASKPSAALANPSGSGGAGGRAMRVSATASGAGRAMERLGDDVGGGAGSPSTGVVPYRGPDLGRHDIPR
ncbi:hypothetical protein IU459_33660 [Nocardia amamiensis]|uniref:TrbL/VirB6 plasmid conjugal transfer protein n=1 Tax=Nocardia amamiensis TaxID=404578 RepID=A0ABS0D0X1_9NOCA|nr:hypothetical protein [Nocardia amamiensis]MBF6302451.1 hypothetical protein [Nocardia amamiensis]